MPRQSGCLHPCPCQGTSRNEITLPRLPKPPAPPRTGVRKPGSKLDRRSAELCALRRVHFLQRNRALARARFPAIKHILRVHVTSRDGTYVDRLMERKNASLTDNRFRTATGSCTRQARLERIASFSRSEAIRSHLRHAVISTGDYDTIMIAINRTPGTHQNSEVRRVETYYRAPVICLREATMEKQLTWHRILLQWCRHGNGQSPE